MIKSMINDKKVRRDINGLYFDVVDAFVDTSEKVDRHQFTKGEAITTLTSVLARGRNQYQNIKNQNKQYEDLFIESDKKMNKLFRDMEALIEKYNADLSMHI